MIIAIVVVLPAPLPLSSPVILPLAIAKEMSSTARAFLYCFTRRATSIAAAAAGRPAADFAPALSSFTAMAAVHSPIAAASATSPARHDAICDRGVATLNCAHDRYR